MPPVTRRKPGPLSFHRQQGHHLDCIIVIDDDDQEEVGEDSVCVICLAKTRCYDLFNDTDGSDESDLFESLEVFLETQLSDASKRAFLVCNTCKDIIEELHEVRILIEQYLLNMKSIQLKLSAAVVGSENLRRSGVRGKKARTSEVPPQCQSFRLEIFNRFDASVSISSQERALADKRLAQQRSQAQAIRMKPSILSELMPKFSSSLLFGNAGKRKRKPTETITSSPKKPSFGEPVSSNINLTTETPAFVSPAPSSTFGNNNNMMTEVVFQCTPDGSPSFIIRKNEFSKMEFPVQTGNSQQYFIPPTPPQPALPVQPGNQLPVSHVEHSLMNSQYQYQPAATVTNQLTPGPSMMYQPHAVSKASATTTSCGSMPSSSSSSTIMASTPMEVTHRLESVQIIPPSSSSTPSASEGSKTGAISDTILLDIVGQHLDNEMSLIQDVGDVDHFEDENPIDDVDENEKMHELAEDVVKTEWAEEEAKTDDVASVNSGSQSDYNPENDDEDSEDPEWKSPKFKGKSKAKTEKRDEKKQKVVKEKSDHIVMENGLKKWKYFANIYEVEPNKWCFRDKLFYCFRPDLDDWCCLFCDHFSSETQSHMHEHLKGHYKHCKKLGSFERRPRQQYRMIKVPDGFTYGGYMVHVNAEGYHQCSACSKIIRRKYEMTKHITREHIRGSELCCSLCGRRFAYPNLLKQHLEAGHETKSKEKCGYMCQHCGKVFKRARLLEHHETTVHPAYPCTLCRRISSTQEKKDNHMLKCHGVAPDGTPVLMPASETPSASVTS